MEKTSYQAGDAPRDSSAESWERIYQADDAGWDLGQASPPLCAFVGEQILPMIDRPESSRVLVPGCGSGHDLVPLAELGYLVTGADFAPSAVRLCQERLVDYEHVRILESDVIAQGNNLCDQEFDWIFDHTFFCALLPAQRVSYAQAYRRVLKEGGEVWVLNMRTQFDNRQPYDCSPEDFIALMETVGFTCIEQRILNEESHQRRRGRECLLRFC